MQVSTSTCLPMTVGLDLGDRLSRYCLRDTRGIVEEGRLAMSLGGMRRGLSRLAKLGAQRVVLETGCQSAWVSRAVKELGLEVVVANPRRVRLISHDVWKSDQRDARILADMGQVRPDLLSPIEHRGEEAQRDLVVLRTRANLVEGRTALVNEVRHRLKSLGVRVPSCSPEAFPKRAQPKVTAIPICASPRRAIEPCGACWSTAPTTSWGPSGRTVTSDVTDHASRLQALEPPRSERSWPWPGSWPCCCSRCGARARSTSPCATTGASRPRPAELGPLEQDL
jgi:Transposase